MQLLPCNRYAIHPIGRVVHVWWGKLFLASFDTYLETWLTCRVKILLYVADGERIRLQNARRVREYRDREAERSQADDALARQQHAANMRARRAQGAVANQTDEEVAAALARQQHAANRRARRTRDAAARNQERRRRPGA